MSIETIQYVQPEIPYFIDDFRRRALESLARKYIVGNSVLDPRCRSGALAVDLAASGFEVAAFDGHVEGVALTNDAASARGLPRFARTWNFKNLPSLVDGRRFDTVLCLDLLVHVEDDRRTIADLTTLLNNGGRFVLATAAFPWLGGQRDETQGHVRRYSRSSLRELLTSHGIVIDIMRYWNFSALPIHVVIEKLFGRRLPDRVRYMRGAPKPSLVNDALRWWYMHVENQLLFPCGMTHFVVGHKC